MLNITERDVVAAVDVWNDNVPVDNGAWRPLSDRYPNWYPMAEGWQPLGPIKSQREKALNSERCRDRSPLTEECVSILRDAWSGRNLWPNSCEHHNKQGPGHFHCYQTTKSRVWNDWRANLNHVNAKPPFWYCTSLQNAASHYSYTNGTDFARLAAALQTAMRAGDELLTATVCYKIFKWGGLIGPYTNPMTKAWVLAQASTGSLVSSLTDATVLLSPYNKASLTAFNTYPIDSGTTKVYAAVALDLSNPAIPAQDVLIYDRRVGAALGLLTRYTLASAGIPTVRPAFAFPRDSQAKRNPSQGSYIFPSLNTIPNRVRAHFTRFAAVCIQQALGLSGPSAQFVAAEKALFMIGYDVRALCCGCLR